MRVAAAGPAPVESHAPGAVYSGDMKVSIVVPAHNEERDLPELLARLRRALGERDEDFEIIVVDDGSTDDSWRIIEEMAERDPRVRGLRLSRNFGHQAALSAGLTVAGGGAVITMDGDLQHPPEVVPALLDRGKEGFDVVHAIPAQSKDEAFVKVRSARAFYALLDRLSSLDLPYGAGDFRYMSRRVVDVLLRMPERHRFLRGMARWAGFAQAALPYDQPPRRSGQTKYPLRKMLAFSMDAIVSFSIVPLRLASWAGFIVAALGALYFIWTLGARLFTDETVPGWTSVVGAVLVLGGVQLVCLGIMGQYVGRMYEEDKRRPLFVVWEDTAMRDGGADRNPPTQDVPAPVEPVDVGR